MQVEDIRQHLTNRLKEEHCFWSYEDSSVRELSDDLLVEMVLLHLDIEDIDLLFKILPYKTVKKIWIEYVIPQGERYYLMNVFFAWFYFHVKNPKRYVKAMMTRALNKRIAA